LQYSGSTQDQSANLLGSFLYNSLADLEAGIPASFTRTLAARQRSTGQFTGSLSLGDSYRRTQDLQIQYGVRIDGSHYTTTPAFNSAVEAAFADNRTYVYNGKEVDRQTHLGFDLARVVNSPVVAANRGKVLHAGPLGIYGNCIILDHGMGVQSLYGHLSSIAVKVGDTVEKEQEMGKSGMTGMAGGDHLHFTMLVNGQMVNPVEWWDAHWIQDRIIRKLREASGS